MNVIFLDFDGVISTFENRWEISTDKLLLLKELCEETNSKIVVTSSWRLISDTLDKLKERMRKSNPHSTLIFDYLHSTTDNEGTWRGDEVERWLEKNEVENYVILDDEVDYRDNQLVHLVQTDTYEGITEREVKLARTILKGEEVINVIRLNKVLYCMWVVQNDIELPKFNMYDFIRKYHLSFIYNN